MIPQLHPSVCANGPWGHNNRCRYTNGFLCEDCGEFVPKTDERWYFTNKFGNRQDRTVRYGVPVNEAGTRDA